MIKILVQIDEKKALGMVSYESSDVDKSCFLNPEQSVKIVETVTAIIKDSEVI